MNSGGAEGRSPPVAAAHPGVGAAAAEPGDGAQRVPGRGRPDADRPGPGIPWPHRLGRGFRPGGAVRDRAGPARHRGPAVPARRAHPAVADVGGGGHGGGLRRLLCGGAGRARPIRTGLRRPFRGPGHGRDHDPAPGVVLPDDPLARKGPAHAQHRRHWRHAHRPRPDPRSAERARRRGSQRHRHLRRSPQTCAQGHPGRAGAGTRGPADRPPDPGLHRPHRHHHAPWRGRAGGSAVRAPVRPAARDRPGGGGERRARLGEPRGPAPRAHGRPPHGGSPRGG